MAATVAATSGKLVPAATIVAPIARSETPNICAIYTAAFITWCDAKTRSHKLAISFIIVSHIHLDSLWKWGISFLNTAKENNKTNIAKNIFEYIEDHK